MSLRKLSIYWMSLISLGLLWPVNASAATPRHRGVEVDQVKGSVEHVIVHGKSLEGNLEGDSPDRAVSIYLPPSYARSPKRRYPVVYLLHGFTQTDAAWYGKPTDGLNVPTIMDRALAAGTAREMILVTPNAMTVYGGSNYSSGATTGDWETFIARELVQYVDSHYRTLANAQSRGLGGHSMGGYGAMRIGMKHPEVFSTLYFLSPCCVGPESNIPKTAEDIAKFEALKAPPADFRDIDQSIRTAVAAAAAWAPNPHKAPLYYDSPFKDGVRQDDVLARMTANRPLVMVDQYVHSLMHQAIAFDVGRQDPNIAANMKELDRVLTAYGVAHIYELYEGTHTSRVPERMETKALPFFSAHLRFAGAGSAAR